MLWFDRDSPEDKRAKLRRRGEVEEELIRGLLSVSVGINLLLQLAFHFTGEWYLQLTISSLLHFIGSFNSKFYHWHFISKFYNPRYHTVCGSHSCLITHKYTEVISLLQRGLS